MPHQRVRYIENNIKKCMDFSGLVGVLGHRQVGKTTVLEKLCNSYYTLDKKKESDEASLDPENYLKMRAGSWIGLDECQLVPSLFPELKDWVRVHKKPGQFLMSGSVRFTSRAAIRESLTGRIINLELLPLTLSEIEHRPLPSFCQKVIELESFDSVRHWSLRTLSELKKTQPLITQYYDQGGLPGICFIRDEKLRIQKINEQFTTLLDRDLRLVSKILLSLSDIKAILTSLAGLQGLPLDYSRIKRETRISFPTIKKVIYALESIFLIRTVPIEGSTSGKTVFFEDQAEHTQIYEGTVAPLEKLIHFCFTQIRPQFEYQLGEATQLFQYRTRGGAVVPLCFRNKKGCLGLIPLLNSDSVVQVLGSVNSFLKSYVNSKVLILHLDLKDPQWIQPRVLSLPVGQVI